MFKVCVSLDDSPESRAALEWAAKTWRKAASFQIVTVVLPVEIARTAPLGVDIQLEDPQEVAAQGSRQEKYALQMAEEATLLATDELGVPKSSVSSHILRPTGGTAGVGRSIVEFVCQEQPDVLVVGSRSLDNLQRTFMGLVGAGSVSDYVLHNVEVPLLVVHWADQGTDKDTSDATTGEKKAGTSHRNIVVSLDDSASAQGALEWTLKHVMQPGDVLHLASVPLVVPVPVLDEIGGMWSERQHDDDQRRQWEVTNELLARAAALAVERGVPEAAIIQHPLLPRGGASDVGESIVQYVRTKQADLLVMGSRGMGAVKAALMSLIGLGSVSEYAMHRAPCPVLVVKHGSLASLYAAGLAAGGANATRGAE